MFISRHFAHIVASLASLLIVASAGAAEFKPPAKAKFKLFLLVGQSNMAGRGTVEDQDKKPHPRVVTLNKEGKWVPAVDPIHFDKPTMTGVGLGTTFGKVVAEANPDDIIGLIPCGFGGTSIAQWSPDKPDGLYADAIKRAGVAMKDGTLAGILWHQGKPTARRPTPTPPVSASFSRRFERTFIHLTCPWWWDCSASFSREKMPSTRC